MGSQLRPSILLITCDQLRFDALGCYGNSIAITPNIDSLAREGVLFDHYFSQSPMCQPSRATIATGRYPRVHGVKFNWYDLPEREITLQHLLTEHGYNSWSVGKMHFEPVENNHGFKSRVFVEGKFFVGNDEYRTYLRDLGLWDQYFKHIRAWENSENYGATASPFPRESYIDSYIGRRAIEVLDSIEKTPFFMWLSFCNPHMPYDPPTPYDKIIDPASVLLPVGWDGPHSDRFPEHRTSSGGIDFHGLTEEKLRRVISHYHGSVALVDEIIGEVLRKVDGANTVVIFTSDHGEFLGHHGMLWKGGRFLYDDLVHVPLLIRYPVTVPGGRVVSHLAQATDILATLLDFAGIDPPAGVQGRSLRPIVEQRAPRDWRQAVLAEGLDVKMIRDYDWKMIFYAGREYGELYDLRRDPGERDNVYQLPAFRSVRSELTRRLAELLVQTEDPLPLPAPHAGYVEVTGAHGSSELR